MKNLPRRMLRQILTKHGEEIYRDARRCENLLKDLCGADRREINVLINAIEERVPLDLLAANPSMPLELLLTRLEKRLEEQTAMTGEAARWSVESWALALNLATESEIQARRKRIETAASKVSKREIIQPDDPSSGAVSNDNRRNPAQPPTDAPPAPQTAPANTAPIDLQSVTPENEEDVMVTTTIKKDKNKIFKSSSAALAETDSALLKLKNSSENKTDEKEKTSTS